MKVLSVDFDYFQEVEKDIIIRCYPDGIDLPPDISAVVWATKYAEHRAELNKVSLRREEYERMLHIIRNQRTDIPVMAALSHISIVDFLEDFIEDQKTDTLEITNIDTHHDLFNDNEKVDCGNWLGYIKDKYDCSIKWFANPVSLKTYGFEKDKLAETLIKTDIKSIIDEQYDLLFLCRSDSWLPPELDGFFSGLVLECSRHFDSMYIQEGCEEDRDYFSISMQIEKAMKAQSHFQNVFKKERQGYKD